MKRTAVALSLVLIGLLASVLILTVPVKAQEPLNLTIKPDGSVEPSTNLLERNGTTYTFKDDIFGTIWVQTNNIIIDGAGHTLQGNGVNTGQNTEIGILLGGPDLSHRECKAVLVKNLRISNVPSGIFSVGGSNNSFIGNYFDKSGMEIQGNANLTGNLIEHNTFVSTSISYDYDPNGTDIITENNFVNSTIYVWLANAPVVDRNYWSNYAAKYPDSKELDSSGIWDTPNVYGMFQPSHWGIDYHPLVKPIETQAFLDVKSPIISVFSPANESYDSSNVYLTVTVNEPVVWISYSLDGEDNITITGNTTLTELTNGLHSLVVYAYNTLGNMGASETVVFTIAKPETFPTTLVITAFGSSLAAVSVCLLAYFKKRKRDPTIPASRLNEQFRKEMYLLSEDLTTQTTF
jgi:hypothetical protein